MSAWETVPEVTDPDWTAWTETEQAAWIADCLDEIAGHWAEGRHHDQDGYHADFAGSTACLALGHLPNPEDPADWGGGEREGHPLGWNDEVLCEATRYGTACTVCEGDCEYEPGPLLWNLPGVCGGARA